MISDIRALLHKALKRARLESTIARNSFFLLVSETLARCITLVVTMILARYLLPAGMGLLKFVVSYGILLGIGMELGLTRVSIREAARIPRQSLGKLLGTIAYARAGASVATFAVIGASLLPIINPHLDSYRRGLILLWSCSLMFQAFRRNAEVVFFGLQELKYQAILAVVNRAVAAVAILVAIAMHGHVGAVIGCYVFADFVDAVAASIIVRKRFLVRPDYKVDTRAILRLVGAGAPFALQLLAGQIYYYIDTVLLKYLYPGTQLAAEQEIGYYSSAFQVVLTMLFIPISISNAVYPALSKAYHEDRSRMRSLFSHNYNLFLLGGVPVAVFFFLFRVEFIVLIFKKDFLPAAPMLACVVWTLPLMFLTLPLGNYLAAADKQKIVTWSAFANAVFNVAFNFYMIPRFRGIGASIATMATELFCLLTLLPFVLREDIDAFEKRRLGKIAALQAVCIGISIAAANANVLIRLAVFGMTALASGVWAYLLLERRRK